MFHIHKMHLRRGIHTKSIRLTLPSIVVIMQPSLHRIHKSKASRPSTISQGCWKTTTVEDLDYS